MQKKRIVDFKINNYDIKLNPRQCLGTLIEIVNDTFSFTIETNRRYVVNTISLLVTVSSVLFIFETKTMQHQIP